MAEVSKKKDVKNLQEQKKALTKIITIQLDQERKGQLEKLTTKIQYNNSRAINTLNDLKQSFYL